MKIVQWRVRFMWRKFSTGWILKCAKLTKCLVDVLWHVDGNHEHINNKFVEKQCKGLPSYFNPVYKHIYNDYKALKKAKPKLSPELLLQYSDSLFDILSVWKNCNCNLFIFHHIKEIQYKRYCFNWLINWHGRSLWKVRKPYHQAPISHSKQRLVSIYQLVNR